MLPSVLNVIKVSSWSQDPVYHVELKIVVHAIKLEFVCHVSTTSQWWMVLVLLVSSKTASHATVPTCAPNAEMPSSYRTTPVNQDHVQSVTVNLVPIMMSANNAELVTV